MKNSFNKQFWWRLLLIIGIAVFIENPVIASDIYYYIDDEGVINFTNSPESSRIQYQLFKRNTFTPTKPFTSPSCTYYDRLISEASRRYGVDFYLIKAVIKAESDFDASAVSPKGARGLMQIMPDNFSSLNVFNPFDPRQNIMGGTLYLRRMLDRFEDLHMAIAAYNAGPNVVASYNGIPPYKETQQYVRRVLRYYRQFNQNQLSYR